MSGQYHFAIPASRSLYICNTSAIVNVTLRFRSSICQRRDCHTVHSDLKRTKVLFNLPDLPSLNTPITYLFNSFTSRGNISATKFEIFTFYAVSFHLSSSISAACAYSFGFEFKLIKRFDLKLKSLNLKISLIDQRRLMSGSNRYHSPCYRHRGIPMWVFTMKAEPTAIEKIVKLSSRAHVET